MSHVQVMFSMSHIADSYVADIHFTRPVRSIQELRDRYGLILTQGELSQLYRAGPAKIHSPRSAYNVLLGIYRYVRDKLCVYVYIRAYAQPVSLYAYHSLPYLSGLWSISLEASTPFHNMPSAMAADLPPELFPIILEYIGTDNRGELQWDKDRTRELKTCSLVCLDWANRCRVHLYRQCIVIKSLTDLVTLEAYAVTGSARLVPLPPSLLPAFCRTDMGETSLVLSDLPPSSNTRPYLDR